MSDRLRHSAGGFLRTMQVSRARLLVFVEGRQLDSYVYARLCAKECTTPFGYKLVRADQLPGAGSGGKQRLLQFFEALRRQGRLLEEFKGQRHAALFFVDKDIDDIHRTKRRSGHIVYTRTYDIEGEVVIAGDLADALAATCSLDPNDIQASMGQDWRTEAMALWREWVELCVTSQLVQAKCVANFGAPSRVNVRPSAGADPGLIAKVESAIVAGCRVPQQNVADARRRAQRLVARG